jgi:hypothetical protein
MAKQREGTNVVDIIEPAPDGFNVNREAWAATPSIIRDETIRMFRELSAGIEKYAPAAERDSGLKEYHDMAAKGGQRLADVLRNFAAMENLLHSDPLAGLEVIAKNAGMNLEAWALQVLEAEAA